MMAAQEMNAVSTAYRKLAACVEEFNAWQEEVTQLEAGESTLGVKHSTLKAVMDTAIKLQTVAARDPSTMDARTVVAMATRGGARVLGLSDKIGSIEKGKRADLVVIDLDRPHLTPLYDPYSHIVYAVRGGDVQTVIIDGRIVMDNSINTTSISCKLWFL